MSDERKVLEKMLQRALTGEGAHALTEDAFDGLDWKAAGARPGGARHSVFEILSHIVYWQEWGVAWLDGRKPSTPKHASASWPGAVAPGGPEEWKQAVERFRSGLDGLKQRSGGNALFAKHGRKTALEMLQTLATHNSYHLGQVVVLRQMQRAWPPPSGGLTW